MKPVLVLLVSLTVAPLAVRAQTDQIDAAEQRRKLAGAAHAFVTGDSAPELYPAESSDVGPQTVLQFKRPHTLFAATVDAQYFYTDNMFLSENGKRGTDELVSTAEFALAPEPYDLGGGTFAPRIGYRHQWFDFGLASDKHATVVVLGPPNVVSSVPFNAFDFNVQTLFTDVSWSREDWRVELGFEFARFMSTSRYDEFYKEYVPHLTVERIIPLNDQAAFAVGYTGDYRFSDIAPFHPSAFVPIPPTDLADRTDHALFASYTQSLCPHAAVQPYAQARFTHFTRSTVGERNDLVTTLGVALYWTVCSHCELRGFVDYNLRGSDNSAVAEYRQFDAGGGVNLTFRF